MSKLLVAGGSGKLGSLVLQHLLDTVNVAPADIITTTRTPETLATFSDRGVDVRKLDLASGAAEVARAFQGARRLLLVSSASFTRVDEHQQAIAGAIAAGVQHLVYTSIPNPVHDQLAIVRDHAQTERIIAGSPINGWTVLRNNWYFENLDWPIPAALESGKWSSANGVGKTAYISRSDLALATAIVLAGDDSGKATYTLTGLSAYTDEEIVAAVSKAYGTPISYNPISVDESKMGMTQYGMPAPLVELMASSSIHTRNGGLANVTTAYATITGRQPQTLEDWLNAKAAA